MNILALETSTPHASLVLESGNVLLFETDWETARNHDTSIFPALRDALNVLGQGVALDLVLVGAGPGSYGGVRVALAAAEGIALVHGARVVALNSWISLAWGEDECCIVSDARRGGWAFGHFRHGMLEDELRVLSRQDVQAALVAYSAGPSLSIESADSLREKGMAVDHAGLSPTASGLVAAWNGLSAARQQELAAKPAGPIYVRPPHITQMGKRPWEVNFPSERQIN